MSIASIIRQARSEGRTLLTEAESKAILAEAGIPTTRTVPAATAEEAVRAAEELGFPVVLKVASRDITHKSDVGGVRLDLRTPDQVREAFHAIMAAVRRASPDAAVQGVTVQEMARPGTEVIIGMTRDPQFGPVLMFGLGGILVELLQDVSFRVVPLTPRDADEMIREIKGFPLLEGYRGSEPADLAALRRVLLNLSAFVEAHPEVKELDLNPMIAYRDGALAVDARMVVDEEPRG
ncbi:MAG TPA: acetate--CoA ligase family protein [Dehalococcoidia bacterium]